MTENTASTLAALARCLTEGGAKPETILATAYQLGKLDGGLEMASIGKAKVESLLSCATQCSKRG